MQVSIRSFKSAKTCQIAQEDQESLGFCVIFLANINRNPPVSTPDGSNLRDIGEEAKDRGPVESEQRGTRNKRECARGESSKSFASINLERTKRQDET